MEIIRYRNAISTRINNRLYNYLGWKTNRRFVVIESDDWGSIRMPSKKAFDNLESKYPQLATTYNRFDSIETDNDLVSLFEVLDGVKDKNGSPAIITANALMANPDFAKIKEAGYQEYYYETIDQTFSKSSNSRNCLQLWKEGNERRLFRPQSHGREHINTRNWINELKKGNEAILYAFNNGYFGVTPRNSDGKIIDILPSCVPDSESHNILINETIADGLRLFEHMMGYKSKTFIASNYKWHPSLETTLYNNGVIGLQGNISHRYSSLDNKEKLRLRKIGQNKHNLIDIARNVIFEPTFESNDDKVIGNALLSIINAFKHNKPAIICSHRINYVGTMSISNRDRNLKLLKSLLLQIKKRYPDVEFISSDMLCEYIGTNL